MANKKISAWLISAITEDNPPAISLVAKPKMAKEKMLTETEASAECLYYAISEATTFGADQAKKVGARAAEMKAAGQIDDATFMAIIQRFGNHSATRQRLEKYGWFTKSIVRDALEVEMRRLQSIDTEAT